MAVRDTNPNDGGPNDRAAILALGALGWILNADSRADRFLSLTGLDVDTLRERAGEPAILAATLGFLENHEPDLIACADALGVTPSALVAAHQMLEAR